ncbi:MAG TPA: hypothetical protein VF796_13205 [Humisphaera sp.]
MTLVLDNDEVAVPAFEDAFGEHAGDPVAERLCGDDAGVLPTLQLPLLAAADWPREAFVVSTALDAAHGKVADRRASARRLFRVTAKLQLFRDVLTGSDGITLYTRNADPRGIGFICQAPLPVGAGGWAEIPAADGTTVRVACTVTRCRTASPGWYEGGIHFTRNVTVQAA